MCVQYFRDPFSRNNYSEDNLGGPLSTSDEEEEPGHELSGVYDFTERLLFEKLWQGEDRSEQTEVLIVKDAVKGSRRRMMADDELVDAASVVEVNNSSDDDDVESLDDVVPKASDD